jgi:hypothetical protein
MLTEADFAPALAGVNTMLMLQFAPTARLAPQLFVRLNSAEFAPARVMLEIVSAAVPVLVSVIISAGLEVLITCGLNVTAVRERETSGTPIPVPVIGTECGLPAASVAMLTDADFAPTLVGVNTTLIVQFAPAARLAPQLFVKLNSAAFAPASAMLEIVSAAVPVLVSVIICGGLGMLINCGGNVTPAGGGEMIGMPTPVPVKGTECGLPAASVAMLTEADFAPTLVGVNTTVKVQFAPAARLAPQPFARMNSAAFGPVSVMLMMLSVVAPLLVSITLVGTLGAPIGRLPKSKLVGEKMGNAAGVIPVPDSATVSGLLAASVAMLTQADFAPALVGVNTMLKLQFAPAARLAPQLFVRLNSAALAPARVMPEIARVAVPVFVSVTLSAALGVLITCGLNVTAVRERETSGTPTPVPVIGTESGLLAASVAMLTEADFAPALAGLNTTLKSQLAALARLAPQPFIRLNSVAFGPVSVMLVMSRLAAPLLVRCTHCPRLGAPMG